ncbi:L-sorbose 1-dehydrogenase, partial [Armadillidium nasatum]
MSSFFLAVSPPAVVINPPITKDLKEEYDFIVAGAVVASRLSENPNFDVLLLEAGGKATETSEIPAFLGLLQRTDLDWNFTVGPSSEFCLGMIDRELRRSFGGTIKPWNQKKKDSEDMAGVTKKFCHYSKNRKITKILNSQETVIDGFRCSTNKAFLVPAGGRKNFNVATYSHVTKVLIDPNTNRAYGVRYFRNGAYHDVLARKEVILSAGVINTPQILMLSGIGPKEHLKELKIPLIKDLPVGFNFHDHVGFSLTFVTDKPITYIPQRYNNLITNMTFDLFKKGPLTNPGFDATAFLNSKFQDPKLSYPDIQVNLLPSTPATDGGLGDGGLGRKLLNLGDE